MNEIHRRALQINHSYLLRELDPDELSSSLYSREVLTPVQYEKLESKIGIRERNLELLRIVPRRGPTAFPELISALKETKQGHIVEELLKSVEEMKREREEAVTTGEEVQTGPPVQPPGPVRPESRNRKKSFRPYYEINSERNNQLEDATNRAPMIRTPIGSDQTPQSAQEDRQLIPSTELFYKETYEESYEMQSPDQHKGMAIICSVIQFRDSQFQQRSGGEIDLRHLQDLLVKLGYRVEVVENRTAEDMFTALQHFSRQTRHKDYPSTVVAVLSHGMNECIYGADGRSIPLNQIISLFDNTACPALQNKPKLFLFQCCRGNDLDCGIDQTDGPERAEEVAPAQPKLPIRSDMIIGFSTLRGHAAMRNTSCGSWYIEALTQTFLKESHNRSVTDMLTKVNNIVKQREGNGAPGSAAYRCKEMSEFHSTLCHPFYFYPGLHIQPEG